MFPGQLKYARALSEQSLVEEMLALEPQEGSANDLRGENMFPEQLKCVRALNEQSLMGDMLAQALQEDSANGHHEAHMFQSAQCFQAGW